MEKINVFEKLKMVNGHWHPHHLGSFNGQEVLLSKNEWRVCVSPP